MNRFAMLFLAAASLSAAKAANAEMVIFECMVSIEGDSQGDEPRRWLFGVDIEAQQTRGLWGDEVMNFRVEESYVEIILKNNRCRRNLDGPTICRNDSVAINRYNLSMFGVIGGNLDSVKDFTGACEVFDGVRQF